MDESTLLEYVREQLNEEPKPTPQTINHRLGVLRCLYRFHSGHPLPAGSHHFQCSYRTRSPLGYGRPQRVIGGNSEAQNNLPISPDNAVFNDDCRCIEGGNGALSKWSTI
jgi:hypothetical protein